MRGTAYEARYVIVDIELDIDWPTERLAWFDPPSNTGRTMLMHRQPDDIWRLDYQLRDEENADEMISPENVLPVVTRHLAMLGIDKPWRLVWTSAYRASALSLESYRSGRVLFAGDAAHLVPIFGVRGLNSGFDDAFNLAWKLAFVIHGQAPVSLLDSYTQERHGAWRTNIAHAMKSTEFMAPPSRGFSLMREAVLSLAAAHPQLTSLINPRQSSAIPYSDSPLNTISGSEQDFAGGPQPGTVVPECPLLDPAGRRTFLTRLLSDRFTLLIHGDCTSLTDIPGFALPLKMALIVPQGAERRPEAFASDVVVAHEADGRFAQLFAARAGTTYLVRPDGHVCARWHSPSASDINSALLRALGRSDLDRCAA
jgi:3-(3-hydroxy-phenyl)propionate hydroxylase